MIGNQLRANADTLDEFSLGHFAFPPFTLMGGVMQATRIFGGEERLETILTDLNAAVFKQPTELPSRRKSNSPFIRARGKEKDICH